MLLGVLVFIAILVFLIAIAIGVIRSYRLAQTLDRLRAEVTQSNPIYQVDVIMKNMIGSYFWSPAATRGIHLTVRPNWIGVGKNSNNPLHLGWKESEWYCRSSDVKAQFGRRCNSRIFGSKTNWIILEGMFLDRVTSIAVKASGKEDDIRNALLQAGVKVYQNT